MLQSQRPLYTVEGGVSQLKVGCCHVHHSASSFVITYILMGDYRGFHKWGTAIAECFIMENPIKMNELGVPLFLGNLHISHITIVVTTACHWFKVSWSLAMYVLQRL